MVDDHNLLPDLLSRNGGTAILPGLQTLHAYITTDDQADYILSVSIASLIPSHLRVFHLELESPTMEPTFLMDVLHALGGSRNTLQELRIESLPDNYLSFQAEGVIVESSAVAEWLRPATSLLELCLPSVFQSHDVLAVIGDLPKLTRLEIPRWTTNTLPPAIGEHTNSQWFPVLSYVETGAEVLERITAGYTTQSCLTKATLTSQISPVSLSFLQHNPSIYTQLRNLKIDTWLSPWTGAEGSVAPLLRLPLLESVRMTFTRCTQPVTDHDIHVIAHAWVNLQNLKIQIGGETRRSASLLAVSTLSQKCPKLRFVDIPLGFDGQLPRLYMYGTLDYLVRLRTRTWNFPSQPMDRECAALAVAQAVRALQPGLQCAEWFDLSTTDRSMWRLVHRHLQSN